MTKVQWITLAAIAVILIGAGAAMLPHRHGAGPSPAPAQMRSAAPAQTPPDNPMRDMLEDGLSIAQKPASPPPVAAIAPPAPHPAVPRAAPPPGQPFIAPVHEEAAAPEKAQLQLGSLAGALKLSSPAFQPHDHLPRDFTCYGRTQSPPLAWTGAPSGTKAYVVFLEFAPDRGEHQIYWTLYNIPRRADSVPAGLPAKPSLSDDMAQGVTDTGNTGYAGPCQPKGSFAYLYRLFALDTDLNLPPGAGKDALIRAMNGHVIDAAELPVAHYHHL